MTREKYLLKGLLFVIGIIKIGEGKRCYTCNAVASLDDCHTLSDCTTSDMQCYATKYLRESDNAVLHDLSCRAPSGCTTTRKRDIALWQSCCATDYCNKHFDDAGSEVSPPYSRQICYYCSGVADPFDCLTTRECAVNEACFTTETIDAGGGQVFNLECLEENICHTIGHHLPFGKRTTMCRACCNENENCNNQFCSKKLGITGENPLGSSVEPITTSTTPAPQYNYNTIVFPSNFAGASGGVADFNCTFSHDDPNLTSIRMVWTFKGSNIYNQTITDLSRVLTIHDLLAADAGTYICDVYYNDNRYQGQGTLTVS